MSYGFDPSELIETKIDLIDKDGFHGVGTADGGNSGGSGKNEGSSSLKNIYACKEVNHDTLIIFYDQDIDNQSNDYLGWTGIGWLFVYIGETKELKREYESWAEFVEDVGYDFSIMDPTNSYERYEAGESVSVLHFNGFPFYVLSGFYIYDSDNKDAIDALENQTINAVAIYNYSSVIIENGDPTCKPTGSFRVSQVSGQFMEE